MKKWMTAATAAAFLVAGPVMAGGDKMHDAHSKDAQMEMEKAGSEAAMGGSGSAGMESQAPMAANEISGKVVKVAGNDVYVEHMGAVVPLQLSKATKFEGGATSKKDIREGSEVTASVKIENEVRNVVTNLRLSEEGVGGSGSEQQQNGAGMEEGTGGAGEQQDQPLEKESVPEPTY